MLEVKTVVAGYKDHAVLRGVSLNAEPGSITTIIGCNGCGKSTLLKTIIGLLPTQAGEITVLGRALSELTQRETARLVAYLPQSKNVPEITAGQFVLHGRFPYLSYPRKYTRADHEIAEAAMKQMDVLPFADTLLAELSGGIRQKVYIAMALAKQSPVIIMDEPTTYLDIGQQRLFAKTVRELADCGKTVVLVLHDILLALKLSDCICIMADGAIKGTGTPAEILKGSLLSQMYDIDIGTVQTQSGIQYYYK